MLIAVYAKTLSDLIPTVCLIHITLGVPHTYIPLGLKYYLLRVVFPKKHLSSVKTELNWDSKHYPLAGGIKVGQRLVEDRSWNKAA